MKQTLIFITFILVSSIAFSESHIKVCGILKFEQSIKRGSKDLKYTIYSDRGYRFEINYLEDEQISILERFVNKTTESKIIGVCAKGDFGGNFQWTGFDTGGVHLTRLKTYLLEADVYYFYKNYDN